MKGSATACLRAGYVALLHLTTGFDTLLAYSFSANSP